MVGTILVAGVSVRMLAELATQAGYTVVALDYFGDADLQACCPSTSILRDIGGRYSAATLADAAQQIPSEAVVYGASFENHPEQVARLAQGRRLLGNPPEVLVRARDPLQLAEVLRAGGFSFPETHTADTVSADPARRWLIKPRRSGGGHSVRPWRGAALPEGTLLQERIAGLVCSAAFVADGERAVLLGLSEQLVGRRAFGAGGFRYCGNLTPPRVDPQQLRAMGDALAALTGQLTQSLGLRGLNGVDFVWDGQRAWTIEINPRPSASLELFEMIYGLHVFDAHVRACGGELPDFALERAWEQAPAAGKAIIYARRDLVIGDTRGWRAHGRRDIPYPGEHIAKGHPICTLLTKTQTPQEAARRLRKLALELEYEQ